MGEEFVKRIRPIGCAMFLILAILTSAVCVTAGRDPIKGYEAPEDMEYYAQNLQELQVELQANVFPKLDGVLDSRVDDGVLIVEIDSSYFAVTRSAILRYYDEGLFEMVRIE